MQNARQQDEQQHLVEEEKITTEALQRRVRSDVRYFSRLLLRLNLCTTGVPHACHSQPDARRQAGFGWANMDMGGIGWAAETVHACVARVGEGEKVGATSRPPVSVRRLPSTIARRAHSNGSGRAALQTLERAGEKPSRDRRARAVQSAPRSCIMRHLTNSLAQPRRRWLRSFCRATTALSGRLGASNTCSQPMGAWPAEPAWGPLNERFQCFIGFERARRGKGSPLGATLLHPSRQPVHRDLLARDAVHVLSSQRAHPRRTRKKTLQHESVS
jgi:hypothetical protein